MPWIADKRWYLNADKTRLCEEGDPEGRSLLCGLGTTVPDDTCRRWLLGPHALALAPDPGPTIADTLAPEIPAGQDIGEEPEPPETGSQGDSGPSAPSLNTAPGDDEPLPFAPGEGEELEDPTETVAAPQESPNRTRRLK